MLALILSIKNFAFQILHGLWRAINHFIDEVNKWVLEIKNFQSRFANLEDTNFQVADLHLKNGDVSDAILRLNIIKKVISPQNSVKANYRLAWCYFIKRNFNKSLSYLRISSDMDDYGLTQYLLADNLIQVPEVILNHYKSLTFATYRYKFANDKINLHIVMTEMFMRSIKYLPSKAKILDLGAFVGLNGETMALVFPHQDYTVTATEGSMQMCKEIKKTGCYSRIENKSIFDFLSNNKVKYNGILALGSLSFTQNLDEYFYKVRNSLDIEGQCVLGFKVGNKTMLDENKIEFVYLQDDIKKVLHQNKLSIMETKLQTLTFNENYLLVVCKAS